MTTKPEPEFITLRRDDVREIANKAATARPGDMPILKLRDRIEAAIIAAGVEPESNAALMDALRELEAQCPCSDESCKCCAAIWPQLKRVLEIAYAPLPASAGTTLREFTNELGNRVRITIEGPASVGEFVVTPMEFEQLRAGLSEHAVTIAPASAGTEERHDSPKLDWQREHASWRSCRSLTPSRGAIPESERRFPAPPPNVERCAFPRCGLPASHPCHSRNGLGLYTDTPTCHAYVPPAPVAGKCAVCRERTMTHDAVRGGVVLFPICDECDMKPLFAPIPAAEPERGPADMLAPFGVEPEREAQACHCPCHGLGVRECARCCWLPGRPPDDDEAAAPPVSEGEGLKACPFCPDGGSPTIVPSYSYPWHRVDCETCGVSSRAVWSKTWRDTRDERGKQIGDDADARLGVTKLWNRRADPPLDAPCGTCHATTRDECARNDCPESYAPIAPPLDPQALADVQEAADDFGNALKNRSRWTDDDRVMLTVVEAAGVEKALAIIERAAGRKS